MDLKYNGAIIDPEFKGSAPGDEDGDIDILYVAAEKLPTIDPILRPSILSDMRK